ncbi:auxin response factor 1 [Artemisia annua]|uniref:Auxin response factor 1 n=1 Tax=Artemisia annua TaxID=35608 RepID=A0A2U1M0Q9_ARTAN|nr:auxin response factor 1 [Artemisia annua]
MDNIAASNEGCFLLFLGAILNLIGLSKKRNYPEGFQPVSFFFLAFLPMLIIRFYVFQHSQLKHHINNYGINVVVLIHMSPVKGKMFYTSHRVTSNRATQSAFIISVNRYLKAQNPRPCEGMKFTMGFESERVPEERFGGTIVAVGDDASSTWPDSEWKSVKVQWDKPLTILPYKVSPWEIELKPSQRFKCSCCLGLKRLFCWGQKVAY